MLQQIAKLFASLRKSLSILQKQGNKVQVPSSFPFLSSFFDRNTSEEFIIQYQQKIKGLLFSAKRLNSDKEVMVKFCSRYNQDVHLYCHSCGFAPALISYSTHGNYIAVVMEKLKLDILTDDHLSKPEIRQQIGNISSRLKEMNYVHGDLRDCNIGIDTDNNKVIVLDFDWSGCHGVDLYPPFMNPVIEWPDGASSGKPLYHDHDIYWLDRLLKMK
jgi:thiamine kinase-like enzyme